MTPPYLLLWLLVGLVLGALYLGFARRRTFQREKRIYEIGLIVAALVYVGFALARDDLRWLMIEGVGVVVYGLCVVLGRWVSFYFVSLGWLLHVLWDVPLHWLGPGTAVVPHEYAVVCLSFDVLVAMVIALRLLARKADRGPLTRDTLRSAEEGRLVDHEQVEDSLGSSEPKPAPRP